MIKYWHLGVLAAAGLASSCDPIVTIPGVACGAAQGYNMEFQGRQLALDYPCDKPAGTPVTVVLNLHGTVADGGKFYQHEYFGGYKFVNTHNLIVVTPKSVVTQWGNGDGGVDTPYLLDLVSWVYTSFSDFDIRNMWVVGHSWGAIYAASFGCREDMRDKVNGIFLMSGGSGVPACSDRVSVLASRGEFDILPALPDQTAIAGAHGCGVPPTLQTITSAAGNRYDVTKWQPCAAKWVHRNYNMIGKGHGFVPTDWPEPEMLKDVADAMLHSRP